MAHSSASAAVVPALLLALLQPSWSAYVSSATVLRPNPQPRSAPVLAAVGTSGAAGGSSDNAANGDTDGGGDGGNGRRRTSWSETAAAAAADTDLRCMV